MRSKWTGDKLKVAVERYNEMVNGINGAVPELLAIVDGAKVTNERIGKRERDKIQEVITRHLGGKTYMRGHLCCEYQYTLYLQADICAPVREFSVEYAEIMVPLAEKKDGTWEKHEYALPLLVTVDSVNAATVSVEQAELEVRKAREALSQAELKQIAATQTQPVQFIGL